MAMTQAQLEYQREYRARTGYAASKKYYLANKENIAKARQANKENIAKAQKAWREANPKIVKASIKRSAKKRETNLSAFAGHAFTVIKSRAVKCGLGLKITQHYLEGLLKEANGVCQVTGLPLSYKVGDIHKASFDRINNNKGYVYGNIQVVSSYVNYAKQEHSLEEMFKVAKAIVEHNSL